MNLFETALSLADRLSKNLTSLDVFLQQVMTRVLPHTTVQACGGYACFTSCGSAPAGSYCTFIGLPGQYLNYSSSFTACEYGITDCSVFTGNCCQ